MKLANLAFTVPFSDSSLILRKLDMLNIDLLMKECATTKAKAKKNQSNGDDQESAFHFVAYMPVNGDIWKFDGLQRQPQKLGWSLQSYISPQRADTDQGRWTMKTGFHG